MTENRREQLRAAHKRWYDKYGREYNRKWRKKNLASEHARQNEFKRAKRKRIKAEVIAAYGGGCNCCGETEPCFLTIDHINNDGQHHRKTLQAKGLARGSSFWEWILKQGCPKDVYAVHCYNCNCGRAINGGVCPHKVKQ